MAFCGKEFKYTKMNEVYCKDKGTLLLDFASWLKGRVCNLRRTKNLEKEEETTLRGSILNLSPI